MRAWLTIPSKAPDAQQRLDVWRSSGYGVAVWQDPGDKPLDCDLNMFGPYPGYAVAVNQLIRAVATRHRDARWFIAAGDDIIPDPNIGPEVIVTQCEAHFKGTYGVMQPTGDPWADSAGRMIERIAGSPWIGRDFALESYHGTGPYFEGYYHCFLDNEIMEVAKAQGCFWQRPDLVHYHAHHSRERRPMPPYLRDKYSQRRWTEASDLYYRRKAAGFPGSERVDAR